MSEKYAIEQLFANLKEAWRKGDGELYASYFTEDCDYIAFDGRHFHGRSENAKIHNQLFKGFLTGSQLVGEIKSIRFLSSEMAVYIAVGAVQLRFQKKAPKDRSSINTNVVIKENGIWKITCFQNTRVKQANIFMRLFIK